MNNLELNEKKISDIRRVKINKLMRELNKVVKYQHVIENKIKFYQSDLDQNTMMNYKII